jgi:hypothetical protein
VRRGFLYGVLLVVIGVIGGLTATAHGQSGFGDTALQDGYRLVEIGKALKAMPSSAKRVEDFTPAHWKVYARADGDLNRDGIDEHVIVLQLNVDDKAYVNSLAGGKDIDFWGANAFLVAVVRQLPNKMFEFDDANYSIGTLPQGDRDEFTIRIRNGVLDIHVSTGGSLRADETYHFRQEPPTGGSLTLIGYDAKNYMVTVQPDSQPYSLSENYLTGERVETITTFDKNGKGVDAAKKSTFKPVKKDFSSVSSICHQ